MLRLTYVSHDMKSPAADQGYNGPLFTWDEEDRLRRRARLDALFFHLYGLDRDAADYVLGTFPIVQREEHARYNAASVPAPSSSTPWPHLPPGSRMRT